MSNVESPQHYTQGYFETIYEIRDILGGEGFKAFCLGNYIKYNARAQHKGLRAEDLAKADQYLDWAVNGLPSPVDGRVPRQADLYAAMAEAMREQNAARENEARQDGEERQPRASETLGAGYGVDNHARAADDEDFALKTEESATCEEVHVNIVRVLPEWVQKLGLPLRVTKQQCMTHGTIRFYVRLYSQSNDTLSEGYIYSKRPSNLMYILVAKQLAEEAVDNLPL